MLPEQTGPHHVHLGAKQTSRLCTQLEGSRQQLQVGKSHRQLHSHDHSAIDICKLSALSWEGDDGEGTNLKLQYKGQPGYIQRLMGSRGPILLCQKHSWGRRQGGGSAAAGSTPAATAHRSYAHPHHNPHGCYLVRMLSACLQQLMRACACGLLDSLHQVSCTTPHSPQEAPAFTIVLSHLLMSLTHICKRINAGWVINYMMGHCIEPCADIQFTQKLLVGDPVCTFTSTLL